MDMFLWVLFGVIILVVLIIVVGQVAKAAMTGVHGDSSQGLVRELREENAVIMSQLTAINENLASINKMLKEID